jgi:hypothetical protein
MGGANTFIHGWQKSPPNTALVQKLDRLPHTPDGDRAFLAIVSETVNLAPLVKLIEAELTKRPRIYDELTRLILRHQADQLNQPAPRSL